jgi:small-conductance mechanosensitive channel
MVFPQQFGDGTPRTVIELLQLPGARVVLALLIVVAGWYLSGLLASALRGNVTRRFRRRSVANVVLRGVRAVVVLAAVFVALPILGVNIGNVLVSVTVISAIVGVILAPLAQNVVSGMLVLVNRPYEIGDMIELVDQDRRGYVDDITLRYTRIVTLNNTFLLIPNETITQRDVVNFSGEDERTRVSLEFTVTYEGDLQQARELAEGAVSEIDGVITGGPEIRIGSFRYPARPRALIAEFADHGVRIDLRFWVRRPYLPLEMRSTVHEKLWEAFEDANVEIPYPHTHLVFDETSGRARVELERERTLAEAEGGPVAESAAD